MMQEKSKQYHRSVWPYWMIWGAILLCIKSIAGYFPEFKEELWGAYFLCIFWVMIILCEAERLRIFQYVRRNFPAKSQKFFGDSQNPNFVEMLGYLITNYSFEDEQLKSSKKYYRRLMLLALAILGHYPLIVWDAYFR